MVNTSRLHRVAARVVLWLASASILPALAMPAAPVVELSEDGNRVSIHWNAVANAQGYRVFYAPYPALTPVGNVDVGLKTAVKVALFRTQSYVVAVRAYNEDGIGKPSNIPVVQLQAEAAGGDLTHTTVSSSAFNTPAPGLSPAELDLHRQGQEHFDTVFSATPGLTNSGLGPAFSHNSCFPCHAQGGRDLAPAQGNVLNTLFLRLSLPGQDALTGGPLPVPGFGKQLFTKSVAGVIAEAMATVSYSNEQLTLPNGRRVSLRTPDYSLVTYTGFPENVLFSARLGPPIFGRGLLEAILGETIVALSDEEDADGDGISGKANFVWHPESGATVLGRFGLKANIPDLRIQTADAFHADIGITSPVFLQESTLGQEQDDGLSDDPEIDEDVLQSVTFFVQTLAVPARRNLDLPGVQRGELLFGLAGCTKCHVPTLVTGEVEDIPVLSNQVIHPWTDMLLHDMGEGLADNRPDFLADGREWRTPPLWGIGLTRLVNGHTGFLHDGRARNLLEAIMWHGGEAEASRQYVEQLGRDDLEALEDFLESL